MTAPIETEEEEIVSPASEVRKMHIMRDRAAIPMVTKTLQLSMLRLDPDNVRFRHLGRTLSDQEAEDFIWDESETKQLYNSIISSGGLNEAPYVTPEGTVKEGNRRVVCLRRAAKMLREEKLTGFPAGTFDNVQCEVLPESVTPIEVDILLARLHVAGKLEWDALNQAEHLYRLHHERGLTLDQICDNVGIGKGKLLRKVHAYEKTVRYLKEHSTGNPSTDVRKFSFFDEAEARKVVRDWLVDPEKEDEFFRWVQEERFDMTGAKDVRKLPEIWAEPEARAAFEKEGGTIKEAIGILYRKDPARGSPTFAAIVAASRALEQMPRAELLTLSGEPPKIEALEKLRDAIEDLLAEVELAQKSRRQAP